MARSLSQQQPTMPSGLPQQAMSDGLPDPLTHLLPLVVQGMNELCNHCHQQRRRQRQGGTQGHWAGHGRQQRDEDVVEQDGYEEDGYEPEEDDNYEVNHCFVNQEQFLLYVTECVCILYAMMCKFLVLVAWQ